MYDLAVIVSTIQERQHLMPYALSTWRRAFLASNINVAFRITSEGFDATETVRDSLKGCDWQIFATEHQSGSHIAGYNYWISRTPAKTYLFTHAEILFPQNTLMAAFSHVAINRFVAFKIFWLPQHMTERIEGYPWQTPEKLEQYDDLYQFDPKEKQPFYWNVNVRRRKEWEAVVTWAMDAETLKRVYPLHDFNELGAFDPFFAGQRQRLGIQTHVITDPILFHQWHKQTWSGNNKRAVALASEALQNMEIEK